VTVAFDGDPDDTDRFLLGSREVLGLDGSVTDDVYSPQSPIGSAVLGKKKGDTATYRAPNGKEISVTILEVEPFES
jgi:transcription elongation factor GreA